jgi:hypothetical protein
MDPLALWTASSLFNAAGFLAALSACDVVRTRNYRRLLWLVPAILVSAWLGSAFSSTVASHPFAEGARLSALYRQMGQNLVAFLVLALSVVLVRRVLPFGSAPESPTPHRALAIRTEGDIDAGLQAAVERFLEAADRADIETVVAIYDPAFTCVRVADEGGFVRLTREQMVSFWKRAVGQSQGGGHAIPARETTLHDAEVIGDIGIVLLTRVKDLGSGWEPLFYNLVWKRQEGDWRLLREYVHQRTVPRWK